MNDSLTTIGDAMAKLSDQRDAAMARARDIAHELALVNLDDASQRYRQAFELFRSGQVDSVLLVLGKEQLDEDYRKAGLEKVRGEELIASANEGIRQLAKSYRLKAQVLEATLNYRDAMATLDRMKRIMDEQADAFDAVQRIEVLRYIGRLTGQMGGYDDAFSILRSALQLAERDLPAQDALTASVHGDLALVLVEQGEYPEAKAHARTDVEMTGTVLGADHYRRGEALFTLGGVEQKAGEPDSAQANFMTALGIWRRSLDPGDIRLCKIQGAIGMTFYREGELDSALRYCERGIALLEEHASPDDPEVATANSNIGVLLADMGRSDQALMYMDKARRTQEKVYGIDHPYVAQVWCNMASVLEEMDRPDSALKLYTRSMASLERSLGHDHPVLATLHSNMAAVYENMGELPKALEETRMAAVLMIKEAGPDHPDLSMIYNSMGVVFSSMGRSDSAIHYLDMAIRSVEKQFGPDHQDAILYHQNKGKVLIDAGLYDQALDELRAALPRALRVLGEKAHEVRGIRANIGSAFLYMEEVDSALVQLDACQSIEQHADHIRPPFLAQLLRDRSNAYRIKGDATRALSLADSSLSIIQEHLGSEHYLTAMSHVEVAHVLAQLGRSAEAVQHFDRALAIETAAGASRADRIPAILIGRAGSYATMGDTTRAISDLQQAMAQQPLAEGAWRLYLISSHRGRLEEALDQLIVCARLRNAWPGTLPKEKRVTNDALKALATKLHRKDVLEEFHLN